MIVIVDYGMGNLGSIRNMLRRIGVESRIASEPHGVADADRLILPGVGAFDEAMGRIEASGLRPVLDRKALEERIPVLGICLGMQLLTRGSEEGRRPGLGWLPGRTVAFPRGNGLKVPHIGWNLVSRPRESPLTDGFDPETRFYFVHSYRVEADDPADVILRTEYGVEFDAAIEHGNVFGAQFHPEKSHRFGMRLLRNFAEL